VILLSSVPTGLLVVSSSLESSDEFGEFGEFLGFHVVVLGEESRASRSRPVSTLNTRGLIVNPELPGKGRPLVLIPGDNAFMTRGCDLMSVPAHNSKTAKQANILE